MSNTNVYYFTRFVVFNLIFNSIVGTSHCTANKNGSMTWLPRCRQQNEIIMSY